ncbi:transcription initiation factor TFIID subunit 4 [Megalops cyprinoides]|uniref:transcription initiation factor TFIID subunit 4 n=1 Tax=Megalops cyprinoides TaxID=118141 RepID=UPI001863F9F9|nr:transcription initiation factor TFIID subunit 4 [Megalops cyprinoides]
MTFSISTAKTVTTPGQVNTHALSTLTNVPSAVSNPVPTIIVNTGQLGTKSPLVEGTKVIQGSTTISCVSSQPAVTVTPKVARVATITQAPGKGTVLALPRATTPQQNGAPRAPQTTTVQLPANFQIPQGMVLIRSDSGQLMLVSQQALAQAQAQGIVPRMAAGASNPAVRGPAALPAGQPTAAAVIRNSEATPLIRAPPPPSSAAVPSLQKVSVVKATGGTVSSSPAQTVRPTAPAPEALENGKKCKNFLVTLIKLASSGTYSAEMAKNVKELVKSLLDGKIEPEGFTDRLYTELKSSPQPYLVPFLKKSLPAVRQLTPNSQLFIQQCTQPKAPGPVVLAANKAVQPGPITAPPLKPAQPHKSTQLVIQQPRGVVIKQSVTSGQPQISLPVQNKTLPKQLVTNLQTTPFPTGAIIKQSPLQVSKIISTQPSLVPKNGFKDSTPGSFREEDDINDVASMAGVNLSEESARILATGSELVGSVVRSCRDDPFIPVAVLQKRLMEIGRRRGITDVSSDAVNLVSHATQERLRELVEKLTVVARHRKISYKDNSGYTQTGDTRSQLKFLEQLDHLEKRRKEEEEREILLRIAKSRSNREDPEQLRLKQRAKEMQQLELAQMQQRDANLTALAAIGPRKKRPLDSRGYGSGNEVPGALGSSSPTIPKQVSIQRITRVSLQDLLFCMEQDPSLRHSLSLYRAHLR